MTTTHGHCPQCHRPAVLHDDHPTCDDCAAWEMDRTHDDDGAVSHTGCLALLAVAWLLLAAGAWGIGAPVSSAVVDAGLAVAVSGVAAVAWLDRDHDVTEGDK